MEQTTNGWEAQKPLDADPSLNRGSWLGAQQPQAGIGASGVRMDARPRIVAIDDEAEFTKTIQQFFAARGFDVHVAMNGIEGLNLVKAYAPQVVLVDLKMPGMDGDELLQRIRAEHPGTPVIVITAYNDGGKTKHRLLELGAFEHFDKPLSSLRDLASAINRALSPAT